MATTENRIKTRIKKGDQVMVIAGRDKGKSGKVASVLTKTNRVLVEGVNVAKRHVKPSAQNPGGGILEKSLPLALSNVMIMDPKTNEPTRIGRKKVKGKDGKEHWVRFAKKSGEVIDQIKK